MLNNIRIGHIKKSNNKKKKERFNKHRGLQFKTYNTLK